MMTNRLLKSLFVATLMVALVGCNLSDDTPLAGESCEGQEGDVRRGLRCEDGVWVVVDGPQDLDAGTDADPGTDPDADRDADPDPPDTGPEDPDADHPDADHPDADQPDADPDACIPHTCEDLGVQCGEHDNGCDGTVDCEGCGVGECTEDYQCYCEPETTAELCDLAGAECGDLTVEDSCEQTRNINCESCVAPETCGALEDNQCDCIPFECDDLNASCGQHPNGCGGIVQCGPCPSGEACGPIEGGPGYECTDDCTPHPSCDAADAECGTASDGCGGTLPCGTCDPGFTCDNNQCECVPQNTFELCSVHNADCGTIEVQDNCGDWRTVTCGFCLGATSWVEDGAPYSCCDGNSACTCQNEYQIGTSCQSNQCVTAPTGLTRTVNSNCQSCSLLDGCEPFGECIPNSECSYDGTQNQSCSTHTCSGGTCNAIAQSLETIGCLVLTDGLECGDFAGVCQDEECQCEGESFLEMCQQNFRNCGFHEFTNSCGEELSGHCGFCMHPEICDAGYQCCNPESQPCLEIK